MSLFCPTHWFFEFLNSKFWYLSWLLQYHIVNFVDQSSILLWEHRHFIPIFESHGSIFLPNILGLTRIYFEKHYYSHPVAYMILEFPLSTLFTGSIYTHIKIRRLSLGEKLSRNKEKTRQTNRQKLWQSDKQLKRQIDGQTNR